MKPEKIRERAQAILDLFGKDGRHWAKDRSAYAVLRGGRGENWDEDGGVDPRSPDAQSWCLLGACRKLDIGIAPTWLVLAVQDYSTHTSIPEFNDEDGWKPIKDLLSQLATHGKIVKRFDSTRAEK